MFTYRDFVADLPRDAGALMGIGMSAPPATFVPEQYHLRQGCGLMIAGFGCADEHARLVASLRAKLQPLFEFVTPMPYTALQTTLDDGLAWGIRSYEKALYLDELSDDAIRELVKHLPDKSSPLSFLPAFRLGGAYSELSDADTAFGGRRAGTFAISLVAVAPTAELLAADRAWVRRIWDALQPHAGGAGSYVNFMAEFEEDRVRAAYGADKYERLAQIKAQSDPSNVFHFNANIRPAVTPVAQRGQARVGDVEDPFGPG